MVFIPVKEVDKRFILFWNNTHLYCFQDWLVLIFMLALMPNVLSHSSQNELYLETKLAKLVNLVKRAKLTEQWNTRKRTN